jgi:hypothetical protein
VCWILERLRTFGIGARRGAVEVGGRLHRQRFMRPLVVEDTRTRRLHSMPGIEL